MTPPQMTLFGSNDVQQPLPLEVAAKHGFALQYHMQADDTILYAVQDWIAGVGQTDQARVMWKQIQNRTVSAKKTVALIDTCLKLPYRAANRKTYQMDFANDVTLYHITQAMSTNTGIRNEVLDFLAKAGAFVDELRQDPESAELKIASHRQTQAVKAGKDAEWIAARETGVVTRKLLTALLKKLNPDTNIGATTNLTYQGTLGQNAAGLRSTLGLGQKQNPRDHMSRIALGYTMVSEEAARIKLSGYQDDEPLPLPVIYDTISTVSKAIGVQVNQMAEMLGIDIVTGKPLLTSGRQEAARPRWQ